MNAKLLPHLQVILATIIVAGSYLTSQKISHTMHPLALTFLRFLISFGVLAPFILLNKKYRANILSTMPQTTLISLFYLLFFVGMFKALQTTSTLNTSTIFTLMPLITAILTIFFLKERLRTKTIAIYLIGLVGTCIVIFKADLELFLRFSLHKGDDIFFFGTISMSIYGVLLKYLHKKSDIPIVVVFNTLLTGCVWLALFMFVLNTHIEFENISAHNIWYLLYLAIPATLITLYLYQKSSIAIGPKKVAAYVYSSPALVAIIAVLFENATISFGTVVGILLSLVVTFLLIR